MPGSNALRSSDAEPRARQGAPTISGFTEPHAFEDLRERLISIARFRHGISTADAHLAYRNAVTMMDRTAGKTRGGERDLRSLLGAFHSCCAEFGSGAGSNRLSAVLADERGRQIIHSVARISPESRRSFQALLGRRSSRG